MTDFMRWMYDHYIKPNIESQPKDDTDEMWSNFLDFELNPDQRKALREAFAFCAVQGFRLGVRTGVTLRPDLQTPPRPPPPPGLWPRRSGG